LAVASWALLETTFLVAQAARARGLAALALDALSARVGVLYLLVIPVLSPWVTFAAALCVGWAAAPSDWLRFWHQLPTWGRILLYYGPLLAVLNLARLLLRASAGLYRLALSAAASQGAKTDEPTGPTQDPPDRRP
jgi:hypothetical protein